MSRLLQDYVFTTKYARYLPEKKRRETYPETVRRMMDMHRTHYADKLDQLAAHIDFAELMLLEQRVLGSQRALQFGGEAILRRNARGYNCTASFCDRPRFFQEAFWLLLCGAGAGFSVQKHHVAKLPSIRFPRGEPVTHVVEDSIEGWADALGVLLSTYFLAEQPFPEYVGKRVSFDFSQVRPEGSPISSGSGKAPGPDPLRKALAAIDRMLSSWTFDGGVRLRPIDAFDILMHASNAVLAGGVRRSATLALFSADDREMMQAKTGDWYHANPQRARANISALLLRDSTTYEQFEAIVESTKQWGEPGFIWSDSTEVVFNPCGEIALFPVCVETGESGWQMCNLSTQNMAKVESMADWLNAARAAAILGTLQAGYTDFKYLGEVSERITRREALLGVSMTGMLDAPYFALDFDSQNRVANVVKDTNAEIAEIIGVNPAARTTCVKPEGTGSAMLGTSSGIHPHHGRRYLRRVQANRLEAPLGHFMRSNPRSVEPYFASANGTDDVITFCVESAPDAIVKEDIGERQLLEIVRDTQMAWVRNGRRQERCAAPHLEHNVSNTVVVRDDRWEEVARYIYDHREGFAGVSLLPAIGDLEYPQAPFCEVWDHSRVVDHYGVGALMASGLIVDGLHAFDGDLWLACDHVLGRTKERTYYPQRDWVRRAHQFAERYFAGDRLGMTHCLKRVHLCKLWEDLRREEKPVDYSTMIEEDDATDLQGAVACAGGACEIV